MFQYSKILESPNKHNVMTSFGIRLIAGRARLYTKPQKFRNPMNKRQFTGKLFTVHKEGVLCIATNDFASFATAASMIGTN